MKLVCIIIVWDDWELCYHQIEHLQKHKLVDDIYVVYSEVSNYGEFSPFIFMDFDVEFIHREPQFSHPMNSETDKRNFALHRARNDGFTHFIVTDSDEYYHPEAFLKEKQRFIDNPDLAGLVCATQVYFKSPTLTIGLDTTLVPFIHKITPTLKHEFNRRYPYAFEGRDIKIDPTRSLNIYSGVEWSEITMHHMSYIRKDLRKKVRNSTAKANIEKSSLLEDYRNAKAGEYCNFYKKVLHEVPNYFNIPEMVDLSI